MLKNARPVTKTQLKAFEKQYDSRPENLAYTAALSKSEMADAVFSPADASKLPSTFSLEVKTRGITNQMASGRCWLFASMNLMREKIAEKCGLEKFELSGNYFAFYDKFEKINFFLESVLDTADLPVGDRTLDWLMHSFGDGGQWDMMVAIVEKYGVVPYDVMPETYQSSHTRSFHQMMTMRMRKCAVELRALVQAGKEDEARSRKNEMLGEFYSALCICFGKPVSRFDFEYRDKDDVFHADRGLTPQEFCRKYVDIDLKDYVSVINAPTADKPYHKTYTVKYLGNVIGAPIRYLNVTMDEMKGLAVRQLQDGEPVWFGSDCGKYGSRKDGLWDPSSFGYDRLFGMDFSLTKEERLDYGDSAMNHAMVICGVNLDGDGKPNRWKIENSWGDEAGRKGYYVASDRWFEDYTYQVIIRKKYLKEEWLKELAKRPVELEPWDPMGTLA